MGEREQMTRSVTKDDVVVISFVVSHVGIDSEHQLGEEFQEYVKDRESPQVVIDLSDVSYVSSGPLGVLTALERDIAQGKGALKFCSVSPYVLETFRAAGLLRLFDVHDNCEEALASFKQSPGGTVAV